MNKYIILAVILVVPLILIMVLNNPTSSNLEQVSSVISVEKSYYDFGEIDIFGGKVETKYILKNEGVEDVTIVSAITSCMCTVGEIGGMKFGMHGQENKTVTIPAGEEKVLTAVFDPLAHGPEGVGKISRELKLTTNSSETPTIKVRFDGNVIKNISS